MRERESLERAASNGAGLLLWSDVRHRRAAAAAAMAMAASFPHLTHSSLSSNAAATPPFFYSHPTSQQQPDALLSFHKFPNFSRHPCRWRIIANKKKKVGFGGLRRCVTATLAAEAVAATRKSPKDTNVLVVGSTGYIGKFVVKEIAKRGYNVIAVARERSGIGGKSDKQKTEAELSGTSVCFADVTNLSSLKAAVAAHGLRMDVVVCCLASRTGGVKDSWRIDYEASKNSLQAGMAMGASHFVLLSAICVQKPLLEFQKAKLKFEAELQACDGITWSIVRPTAFFKSLGGQVETVRAGSPYVMFGDGKLCACKPISEADLASFIADCISDEGKRNKVLPIGGPGKAYTPLEQGQLLFKIMGKEPRFIKVPIQIMDFAIAVLDNLARVFPSLKDPAEFGKIGRYYAAESMLVLDPVTEKYDEDNTPSYGSDTLEAFFEKVVREGMPGQELGDQAVF